MDDKVNNIQWASLFQGALDVANSVHSCVKYKACRINHNVHTTTMAVLAVKRGRGNSSTNPA